MDAGDFGSTVCLCLESRAEEDVSSWECNSNLSSFGWKDETHAVGVVKNHPWKLHLLVAWCGPEGRVLQDCSL